MGVAEPDIPRQRAGPTAEISRVMLQRFVIGPGWSRGLVALAVALASEGGHEATDEGLAISRG